MIELVRKSASATNGGELDSSITQVIPGAKTFSGAQTFQQPISGFISGNDYRNIIINGNMDFSQRVVAVATAVAASTRVYGADRFWWFHTIANNPTSQWTVDAPTSAQSGFASLKSIKLTNSATPSTPTGTQELRLIHRLEGYEYQAIHGMPVRLQFWVKTSVSGTYSVSFQNTANTRSYVSTYTIAAGEINTWVKRSVDLTMDSNAAFSTFDNGQGVQIQWHLTAGPTITTSTLNQWQAGDFHFASTSVNWAGTASATWQIAQVALMPGTFSSTVNISFNRTGRTIADELRLCQRYYQKSNNNEALPSAVGLPGDERYWHNHGNDTSGGGGSMWNSRPFVVPMRAPPTMASYAGNGGQLNFIDGYNLGAPTYSGTGQTGSSIGGNANFWTINYSKAGQSTSLWIWWADAEL